MAPTQKIIVTCASQGGRPKKFKRKVGRPKVVLSLKDIMPLDSSTPIPPSIEKAVYCM